MKSSFRIRLFSLMLSVLCLVSFCLIGCSSPGESADDIHRRHARTLKTNLLQTQDDLDAVLLFDRPGRLSDKVTR